MSEHAALPSPLLAANGVLYYPVPAWSHFPWLWHGFSTRIGGTSHTYGSTGVPGELNLGFTAEDERERVLRNRALLVEAVTARSETPLSTLRQVHSAEVTVVRGAAAGQGHDPADPCRADGQMTSQPGILLAVQTADCIPVLVADTRKRVVAGFHAGWRGTVQRIVESGVARMRAEFGCAPQDMVAAIGPGIGSCCYTVGPEVVAAFEAQFAYARQLFHDRSTAGPAAQSSAYTPAATERAAENALIYLDLIEANRRQLLDAGLSAAAVAIVPGCTYGHPETFFSHRRSGGRCGRMMSVIGINPGL